MLFNAEDPTTWPLKISLIAHDVGRTRDRSTAVIGGNRPLMFGPPLLGVKQFLELPTDLFGSALAGEMAKIDRRYDHDCLIIVDVSNDASYLEALYDVFGPRVIGVHIGRSGDGMTWERRKVRTSSVVVYHVGRTFLLELLLAQFRDNSIRFGDTEESRRAYAQLEALEPEQRESRIVYKCPAGQHDDLAMSLAMLAWAAQHLHYDVWTRPIFAAHQPARSRLAPPIISSAGWT